MRNPAVLLLLLLFLLIGCTEKVVVTEYVCSDGNVVSDANLCPAPVTCDEKICPDVTTIVEQCDECPACEECNECPECEACDEPIVKTLAASNSMTGCGIEGSNIYGDDFTSVLLSVDAPVESLCVSVSDLGVTTPNDFLIPNMGLDCGSWTEICRGYPRTCKVYNFTFGYGTIEIAAEGFEPASVTC